MLVLSLLLLSTQQVAVLQSGSRVPIVEDVTPGPQQLQTPFGTFDATLNPVINIADASSDSALLAPLKDLDYAAWLERCSERGLLLELTKLKVPAEHQLLWQQLLENWGQQLNPLPPSTKREKRVSLLWQQLQQAADAQQLLLTGALLREISESSQKRDQRISFLDLRRALRNQDPQICRAGLRIIQKQEESGLERDVFQLSLQAEHPDLAQLAAQTSMALEPEQSLGRWTLALWHQGREEQRIEALHHLESFHQNRPEITRALILTLGASANSSADAPRRHVFFGRQISVVQDFDVEVASSAVIANPVVGVLVEGSVLEVRVLSTTLSHAIQQSLSRITGAHPGNRPEDWVQWWNSQD